MHSAVKADGVKKDVLIVGARCAGAPLAMLLARKGFSVTAFDRCAFPSDTISTHFIWPTGVAALQRWAILDSILAARPARCSKWLLSAGGADRRDSLEPVDGIGYAVSLRRFTLDALLVRAAREAGAEIREQTVIDDLVFECGAVVGVRGHDVRSGEPFEERAALVVGADGKDSLVARSVRAATYNAAPSLTASYYTYVIDSETDTDTAELYTNPPFEFLLTPTDDGLTMVNLVIASALIPEFRKNVETNFFDAFERHPRLARRLRSARQVAPVKGAVHLPNFFRQSFGTGWALAGDAGYHRDPIRAQGIHDAFLDAEDLANAIARALCGKDDMEGSLRDRQERRDYRTRASYERSLKAAMFELPDAS